MASTAFPVVVLFDSCSAPSSSLFFFDGSSGLSTETASNVLEKSVVSTRIAVSVALKRDVDVTLTELSAMKKTF